MTRPYTFVAFRKNKLKKSNTKNGLPKNSEEGGEQQGEPGVLPEGGAAPGRLLREAAQGRQVSQQQESEAGGEAGHVQGETVLCRFLVSFVRNTLNKVV